MTTTKTSGALEKTRRRIKRGGRTNYIICLISEIILGAMMLGQAALTVAVLYGPKAAQYIGPRLNNNFLFNFLKRFAGIDTMPEKYQAAIGCAVLFIMYVSLFIMLRVFARMMKYLAEGDRPLDVKAARQMRHRAYTLLLMREDGIDSFSGNYSDYQQHLRRNGCCLVVILADEGFQNF